MKRKILEAVISSAKSKPFLEELRFFFEDNDKISFNQLASMAAKYGIEVVNYDTFYDELPELWKKGQIPHKGIEIFGLANPVTKRPRLVVTIDSINKKKYSFISIVVSHEFVHAGQMDRLKPGFIYIPPKTVYDLNVYYSDKQEIMAWSKTIVDDLIQTFKPQTFEEAMEKLPKGHYYKKIKEVFKDDPKVWNKYLKNIYNYLRMEFEPVEEKSDLSELRKKIREILSEDEKMKINYAYFQQLLDKSRTDLKNRNYLQGILNSIRKAGGMGTKRQYAVLKRFETGDTTPYSSKN
ncbi:MAG: hypothetical protein LW701_01920 [Fluviicola sp.]|jgi:hypothetical protein|nr:hypothetical protein [Fluviicola sp.]